MRQIDRPVAPSDWNDCAGRHILFDQVQVNRKFRCYTVQMIIPRKSYCQRKSCNSKGLSKSCSILRRRNGPNSVSKPELNSIQCRAQVMDPGPVSGYGACLRRRNHLWHWEGYVRG